MLEFARDCGDAFFPCPFHQSLFLREVIPQVSEGENLSFLVVENHMPLAVAPLFRRRKWGLSYGTMSPVYCNGPAFSSEFTLKKKVEIAHFFREQLKRVMREENLFWVQFRQNVFSQPPFRSLDLGFFIADLSTLHYALVLDVRDLEVAFARMESKARRAIRRAEKEKIRITNHPFGGGEDAELTSRLQARVYTSKGYQVEEGRIKSFWQSMGRLPGTQLFVAWNNRGAPVAFAIVHLWDRFAYYSAGGALRDEEQSIGASNLLQWKIMQFLNAEGIHWYDLSHSDLLRSDNEDKRKVAEFKRSLGAENYPYLVGLVTRGDLPWNSRP